MSSVKFGIITQARLGSTRLPGKVFKKIKDKSLLEYHLDGLRSAKLPIIVATTDLGRDDEIAKFCQRNGIQFFRGSETDVLKRFYKAAQHFNLDYIVRVTSDCPLIRGNYISEAIKQSEILSRNNLYVSNVLKRTFPRGFDFEIFSFQMLEDAFLTACEPFEREHVTPAINRKALAEERNFNFCLAKDFSRFRLTVDTPEDFELVKVLIENFQADTIHTNDLFDLLENNPDLTKINSEIVQKTY